MKASYIRSAAQVAVAGKLSARHIERLPTDDAETALCELRGIGPWSAALVLLRGLGRLDAFPLGDAGAVRGLKRFSVSGPAQTAKLLSMLGDTRGMLYFHLLLARRMTTGDQHITASGFELHDGSCCWVHGVDVRSIAERSGARKVIDGSASPKVST